MRLFDSIEQATEILEQTAKNYNRNYRFCLKSIPKSRDIISGYCMDQDPITGEYHGEFTVRVDHFMNGRSKGCKKCSGRHQYSNDDFLKLLNSKYPYEQNHLLFDRVNYIDKHHKVEIGCEKHGYFQCWPDTVHSGKFLCRQCMFEALGRQKRIGKEEFINRAEQLYGNELYDFSLVQYKSTKEKVSIICKEHGKFDVYPSEFLNGSSGCPICRKSMSRGEFTIFRWLLDHQIDFIRGKYIISSEVHGRKSNKICPDFITSIGNNPLWIEFNGEQHYKFIDFFHKAREDFDNQVNRDISEKEYCLNNGIDLLVIPYYEINSIPNLLEQKFFN